MYDSLFEALDAMFSMDPEKTCDETYSMPHFPSSELIYAKDGTAYLNFALAGYKKTDFSITTEENKIVVSTVEEYKEPEVEGKLIGGGIRKSPFKREFTIPETKFKFDEISAKFEDGILSITIPPKEKKVYKPIDIK